jgi:predicted SnoaL-like aldol condensation-catalyzing enzyme
MSRFTIAALLLIATGAWAQPPGQPPVSFEQRLAMFKESPPEEAAKQTVLTYYKLRIEGKYMQAISYLSPQFTEHMTPARMPKNGKTGYQVQLEQAQRMTASGQKPNPKQAAFPYQARASEDLVTLFHAFGCDIFRVQNGKVTDHWDCTPWQPFSSVGELQQLKQQGQPPAAPATAPKS